MKEKTNNRLSEEEDSEKDLEAEELKNAGSEGDDDWQPEEDKGRKRAAASRKSYVDKDSEGGSEEEDDPPAAKRAARGRGRGRGRGGGRGRGTAIRGRGRSKSSAVSGSGSDNFDEDNPGMKDEEGDETSSEESEDDEPAPPQFQSGCFVVSKQEYDDSTPNHPLWKIDGKSLLQKYVPSEINGEKSYVSTTIYAGWNKTCIEKYYSAAVTALKQDGRDHYVRLDRAIKEDIGDDDKSAEKESS